MGGPSGPVRTPGQGAWGHPPWGRPALLAADRRLPGKRIRSISGRFRLLCVDASKAVSRDFFKD